MRHRIAAAAVLGAALLTAPPASAELAEFDNRPLPLEREVINDIGVADIDGDGDADLYSTNHSNPSSILRNDGGWTFTDVSSAWGFDQTPQAPSWNVLGKAPDMSMPGLYIWAGWDHIEIRSTDPAGQGRGTLSLYSPVEATTSGGAAVEVVQGVGTPPPTSARFTLPAGGRATLRYTTPGHSFESTQLQVDPSYPLERVHLGAEGETPTQRTVALNLRDRHAIVWGQLDSDVRPDALIVRGGLKRSVYAVDRRPSDELFVAGDGGFNDRAAALGIDGQVCSGREARQIDLGAGSAAELLIACRSALPRIHRRGLFGFTERPDELPRAMKNASWYLPFDLGAGHGRVLIVRRKARVHLVGVRRRDWRVLQSVRLKTKDRKGRNHKRITRGDIDGDGDMDAFVPDPRGSTLLVNRGGKLRAISPRKRRLPRSSRSAAMVDFDLDGRLDLHLMPQGFFRQKTRKRFVAHRDPEGRAAVNASDVTESWADLDGDLDLDAVVGEQPAGGGPWHVRGLENIGETGNAIALRAAGRIENTPAFGARVRVKTGRRWLTGWIGQNNTNSYGQGNYDLVFGLGGKGRALRVVVTWPDGTRSVRRKVRAGTKLLVRQR